LDHDVAVSPKGIPQGLLDLKKNTAIPSQFVSSYDVLKRQKYVHNIIDNFDNKKGTLNQ